MANKSISVNTFVPIETEKAMQIIAKEMGVSRSDVVRMAISEYLKGFDNQFKVTRLPGPDDGEVIPVVEVKDIRYPMRSE
jgi:hypothetical protein